MPEFPDRCLICQTVCISHKLYGNDIMSVLELGKEFMRPLTGKYPLRIPKNLRATYDEPIAKRKLKPILPKSRVAEPILKIEDRVKLFVCDQNGKREKCSESKTVMEPQGLLLNQGKLAKLCDLEPRMRAVLLTIETCVHYL